MKIGALFHSHPSDPTWSHTRLLREVLRFLAAKGDKVVAFVPEATVALRDPWEGIEVRAVRSPMEARNSRLGSWEFPRKVGNALDSSFDAMISSGDLGGGGMFERGRRKGVLGVDWVQGVAPRYFDYANREGLRGRLGLSLERMLIPPFERSHLKRADVVIAASKRNKDDIHELYGLPLEAIYVLPNGATPVPPVTPEERAAARKALGLEEGRHYASFVGVDWYRKGLDVLRKSVETLQASGKPWTILNAGNSKTRSALEIGYGFIDGPTKRQMMAASDVFAFPTRYEGSPLPLPEAAGLGLPIITTAESSVDRGVPGTDYVEVPAGDAKALVHALEWVADHPQEARAMGERARSTFFKWTWEDQANELRRILSTELDRRRTRAS